MITVTPLTADNIDGIADLYATFRGEEAQTRYYWDHEPIEFDVLKKGFAHKMLSGYCVLDSNEAKPIAFMLYRALEINLVYIPRHREEQIKTITDRLMRRFLEDVKSIPGWDVISFAQLGPQADLIRTILRYGFEAVGQAIVKFNIMDPISLHILKTQNLTRPEGYLLEYWKPEYAGDVAQCVYEAFSGATDAYWDPRFKTELGAKKVVGLLTAGQQGPLIPECTSVLFYNDKPAGFFFLVQATMTQGNVPLIGVGKEHRRKKLGHMRLRHTLDACVENILAGKVGMLEVSATHDTDNFAAIKMYRQLGFRDYYNYPHVYLPHEKMQQMVVGKWC